MCLGLPKVKVPKDFFDDFRLIYGSHQWSACCGEDFKTSWSMALSGPQPPSEQGNQDSWRGDVWLYFLRLPSRITFLIRLLGPFQYLYTIGVPEFLIFGLLFSVFRLFPRLLLFSSYCKLSSFSCFDIYPSNICFDKNSNPVYTFIHTKRIHKSQQTYLWRDGLKDRPSVFSFFLKVYKNKKIRKRRDKALKILHDYQLFWRLRFTLR